MTQPGDEFEVTTDAIAHGGASVARHEGRVVFVRDAVPGERLRVRVDSLGKGGRFANAHVLEVLEASADRRKHPWPQADVLVTELPVGGADYGHVLPEAQRRLKAHVIREQLTRLGGLDPESSVVGDVSVEPLDEDGSQGWRTRVHWAVDGSGRLGMHPYHGSDIVPVEQLPFAVPAVNELRLWDGEWRHIQRVDVAAPAGGRPPLILFTAADGIVPQTIADDIDVELATCLPAGVQASAVIAPAPVSGRGRGEKPSSEVVRGESSVLEDVSLDAETKISFRVGAGGFWQNHASAPARLARIVSESSGLQDGETAWDLYGGAGLLTAALADRVGASGTVWNVEGSPVTAADSEFNFGPTGAARTPRARETTVVVTRSGVEQALRMWDSSGRGRSRSRGTGAPRKRPDVVVLDPPRQGAGRRVMEALADVAPRRIVYVACDPAALGRDTGYLRAAGWELTQAQGLDMYPDTHHVETIAVFEPAGR